MLHCSVLKCVTLKHMQNCSYGYINFFAFIFWQENHKINCHLLFFKLIYMMKHFLAVFPILLVLINNVLKPSQVQRHTRLNIYKILALPVLTCGSETWTIRKADKTRLSKN